MRCPHCGVPGESKVIESRFRKETQRRRHECLACGQRYSTIEVLVRDYEQHNPDEAEAKNLI